ncbi:MAG TPA: S8 family serine peptidase [Chthoniobacterales bacterium]
MKNRTNRRRSSFSTIIGTCAAWSLVAGYFATTWNAAADVLTSTNLDAAVYDESSGIHEFDFSSFSAYDGTSITDVSISLTFSKAPDDPFSAPFYDEINIGLLSPDFSAGVWLIPQGSFDWGADGDAFTGTLVLSDLAPTPVNIDFNKPQSGTFQPIESLSLFTGTLFASSASVPWSLLVEDTLAGAPLTFESATLSLTVIPEPSTWALAGVGLAALFLSGTRRRRLRHRSVPSLILAGAVVTSTVSAIQAQTTGSPSRSALPRPVSLMRPPAIKGSNKDRVPAPMAFQQPLNVRTGEVNVVVQLSNEDSTAVARIKAGAAGLSANAQKSLSRRLQVAQTALSPKLSALGAREVGRMKHSLNALIVAVDASKLPAIRRMAGVKSARIVNDYQLHLSETVPYIGATALQDIGVTGAGVTVAVLDSGIDYTHKNLGGPGTVAAYNKAHANPAVITPGTFPTAKVIGGYDFVGESWPDTPLSSDPNPIDFNGHGTHVADIIGGKSVDGTHKGVAPDVSLYAIKVCSAVATSCSGVAQLLAVEYALDPNGDGDTSDHVDVINLSLGASYGQIEDDGSTSLANAVKLGVVVVASAGNSADRPYIVGSPSSTPEVISVAQTTVPSAKAFPLVIQPGSSASGTYPNTNTVDWAPVAGTLTAPLIYGGLGGGPSTLPPGTTEADFAGKIVLVDRGSYNISSKVDYFADLGALGVVLANNAAGDPPSFSFGGSYNGTPFNPIPTIVITSTLGFGSTSPLRVALAAGPVTATISDANAVSLAGAMASTSSRGPSVSYNEIKPDIGAPGASVSALVGTGTGEEAFGGTSGAAPMVAGASALLLQKFPAATPLDIKARLMNSAYRNIVTNPQTAPGVLAPITRIGAGEVRVDKAAALKTTAIVLGERSAPSLSFGFHRVVAPKNVTKTVAVRNYASSKRTYEIASSFRYANDAASGAVTINLSKSSLTVPANGTASFDVTARITPALLPDWTLNGGSLGGTGSLLQTVEFDGYVTIKDAIDTVALPFQILPHKAAGTRAPSSRLVINGTSGSTVISNAPSATAGYADVFSLIGTSPRVPTAWLPTPGSNYALPDVQNVGVRLVDFGSSGYGLQFGISSWGTDAHPNYPKGYIIDIDTTGDSNPDYTVFNAELTGFGATGQNIVAVGPYGSPSGTVRFYNNADLNSTNTFMSVLFSDLGGITYATPLTVSVYAWDNYFTGYFTDGIENMRYTPVYPKFLPAAWSFTIAQNANATLGVLYDPLSEIDSPSQTGLLLLLDDAKEKVEAQAITVTTSQPTP